MTDGESGNSTYHHSLLKPITRNKDLGSLYANNTATGYIKIIPDYTISTKCIYRSSISGVFF